MAGFVKTGGAAHNFLLDNCHQASQYMMRQQKWQIKSLNCQSDVWFSFKWSQNVLLLFQTSFTVLKGCFLTLEWKNNRRFLKFAILEVKTGHLILDNFLNNINLKNKE